MTNISEVGLSTILELHAAWLEGHSNGKRADLRGADLYRADLYGANLQGADLRNANLYGANLMGVDLCEADLRDADLRDAILYGANFRDAKLYGTDFYGADLRGANLQEVDLRRTNLYRADLRGAQMDSAAANEIIPLACPDSGSFIGYKKARDFVTGKSVIVKLLIPEDAKRLSATGRKCRCDKALVLEFQDLSGNTISDRCVVSQFDSGFIYRIGETVYSYRDYTQYFDPDRWNECAPGIHFFITRSEAVSY